MLVEVEVEVMLLHPQVVQGAELLVEEDRLLTQMAETEVTILVAVAVEIIMLSAKTEEMADQV
jgi:hypothetical protein